LGKFKVKFLWADEFLKGQRLNWQPCVWKSSCWIHAPERAAVVSAFQCGIDSELLLILIDNRRYLVNFSDWIYCVTMMSLELEHLKILNLLFKPLARLRELKLQNKKIIPIAS